MSPGVPGGTPRRYAASRSCPPQEAATGAALSLKMQKNVCAFAALWPTPSASVTTSRGSTATRTRMLPPQRGGRGPERGLGGRGRGKSCRRCLVRHDDQRNTMCSSGESVRGQKPWHRCNVRSTCSIGEWDS